jgi:DNA-binding GntR family transcriptional regulator
VTSSNSRLLRPEQKQDEVATSVRRGTPLYEQIYDMLWNRIFSGEILPDQRLSDRDWALRLQTSRTPVREAMRQMARDGVLLTLENGGYQVRPADPQGLANLYRCRAPLAALAVHDTTVSGNERLFKQIKVVVESTSKAIAKRDAAAALKFNSKFHHLIVESSGNTYLIIIMSNLEKLILFYRVSLLDSVMGNPAGRDEYFVHLARGNERQRAIVDAMMQGNPDEAKKLMNQHLLASADDMAHLLRPRATTSATENGLRD